MQLTIFDTMYEKKIVKKPIRLIECFGGYGSQHFSLEYLGANFEHYKLVEWAVKSIQAYKDAHYHNDNFDYSKEFSKEYLIDYLFNKHISMDYNEPMKLDQIKRKSEDWLRTVYNNIQATKNIVDVSDTTGKDLEIVDKDTYEYIMTYSFPCQDLSLAGLRKGMSDSSTRSGMLWEVERILEECATGGALPQILVMENVPQVKQSANVQDFNKWQNKLETLGYKNYFEDLIATDYEIPQTRNRTFMVSLLGDYSFNFPEPIKLRYKLKDFLEKGVDESYYLSSKQLEQISNWNAYEKPLEHLEDECVGTLTTRSGEMTSSMKLVKETFLGTYQYAKSDNFMQGKPRFQKGKEVSDTIQTTPKEGIAYSDLRIRKLTPKECFRLMGVKDEDYELIAKNQSDSSLYHLAGDSIVTTVLMGIFGELLGINYVSKIEELVESFKEE